MLERIVVFMARHAHLRHPALTDQQGAPPHLPSRLILPHELDPGTSLDSIAVARHKAIWFGTAAHLCYNMCHAIGFVTCSALITGLVSKE